MRFFEIYTFSSLYYSILYRVNDIMNVIVTHIRAGGEAHANLE